MAAEGSRRSRAALLLTVLAVLLVGGAVAAWTAFYLAFLRDLPDLHQLADYRPPLATTVLDRQGHPIGEFFEERRRLVHLSQVPAHVVHAFVASEDDAFYEHRGIDYRSILRAAWVDLVSGEIRQGASTITQQTVKSLLLTPERRWSRKIKELILARRLEKRFGKDEILELYLNQIYFGGGAWGLHEAARTYFGKPVRALGVSEGALLAGLPKAPSRYSPSTHPEGADERRRYVLRRMHEEGYLDEAAYDEALADRPAITGPAEAADFEAASWFTEEVRRRLFERLDGEQVLRGGLVVETTLDLELQRQAVAAVRSGLEALDRRQSWSGPLRRVEKGALDAEVARLAAENALADAAGELPEALPADRTLLGVVTRVSKRAGSARVAFAPGLEGEAKLEELEWARLRPDGKKVALGRVLGVGDVAPFRRTGDPDARSKGPPRVTLHPEPRVEGALLSFEIPGGDVLAMVGGYDFARSQFNRAVQARRQPGSAFKPIIYAAALAKGYTPVTILHDRPVVYSDPKSGFTWRPENYGRRFLGPIPLRTALARSVNNATIHLLRDVGVGYVTRYAQRLGIRSPLARDLSIALGASSVSLLELTRAFSVFPAGGELVTPRFIRRVLDREGNVLLENVPLDAPEAAEPTAREDGDAPVAPAPAAAPGDGGSQRVVPASEAYLVTDLLRAVISDPRGTGRRAGRLERPLGGKTGTTNEQGDAWFLGFSPDVITGVWVGHDEKEVLGRGETGSRAALPIWIDFMEQALAERAVRDFPVPPGIVFARVDRASGLLSDAGGEADSYVQAFAAGTEPTQRAERALPEAQERRLLRLDF